LNFSDLLAIAAGNLLRLRLRTVLTTAGVVIAIAAFVAMLSFGAGNQKLVSDQYEKFGLLYTMQVYPQRADGDTKDVRPLDDSALADLALVPGVRIAFPLEAISVEIPWQDTVLQSEAQGISLSAFQTKQFTQLAAGSTFTSDSAREVLIAERFLDRLGIEDPDSALGRELVVTVQLATLDSALIAVFTDPDGELRSRLRSIRFDSLRSRDYLERTVRTEFRGALQRFLDGLGNDRALVAETLTVRGVLEGSHMRRSRGEELILPVAVVRRLTAGGISDDPAELFASLSQGRLPFSFSPTGQTDRDYSRVTLILDTQAPYQPVKDSVTALGFRSFSYAEQFAEITEFFLYFDLALAAIGLIALVTASLGIANTLIMATVERKREIGVLQSLGAHGALIRRLFFVESGIIGSLGAAVGVLVGWGISRLGSVIAQSIMESKGATPVDFFDVPLWLVLAALAVGIGVSVAAGYYPASKASRIDPVEALRGD
jgi:ABC-type antimicrobial peptide transport system permease subunit